MSYSSQAGKRFQTSKQATAHSDACTRTLIHSQNTKTGEAPLVCDVMDHELSVNARMFCPVDAESIPTGEVKELHGTEFDLTTPTRTYVTARLFYPMRVCVRVR